MIIPPNIDSILLKPSVSIFTTKEAKLHEATSVANYTCVQIVVASRFTTFKFNWLNVCQISPKNYNLAFNNAKVT